jgi:hypothetical protein
MDNLESDKLENELRLLIDLIDDENHLKFYLHSKPIEKVSSSLINKEIILN